MNSVIATENPVTASKLRKALAARGHDCPITHVVPLEGGDLAIAALPRKPDLLLVVLPTDEARGVRIVQKLRPSCPGRLVAVGVATDARRILDLLHAGADDFLDEDADTNKQLSASLERLAGQMTAGGTGATLAVAAASGGSGASLLAASLSILVARRHESCGLIDLASQFGDLSALLNLAPRHTLAELVRHEEMLDQEMLTQSLTPHDSGIRMIAAPATEEDYLAITGSALDRIVQFCRRLFPWTVIDLGTQLAGRASLLRSCEKILVPFRLEFASLCNTRRLLDDWDRRQIDLDRVVLVANRCSQAGELPRAKVATLLGRPVEVWLPDEPLTANLSVNCGVPVVDESPQAELTREIRQLAQGVFGNMVAPQAEPAEAVAESRPLWSRLKFFPRIAGMVF